MARRDVRMVLKASVLAAVRAWLRFSSGHSAMRAGKLTALEALDWAEHVRPGDLVVWAQASAEPTTLTSSLVAARHTIGSFRVFAGISYGESVSPDFTDSISYTSYCGTGENRRLGGALDILPIHYSQLPNALAGIANGNLVLLLSLAPGSGPDHFSYGVGGDYAADLITRARTVIAEVSSNGPRTGAGMDVKRSDMDVIVETDSLPPAPTESEVGPVELQIADHVAGLIRNGSVLQIGLGTLPAAILKSLRHLQDLGLHSGLLTKEVAELCEAGVITNSQKTIDRGYSVTGLLSGDADLMKWADQNPAIRIRPSSYTHAPHILRQIDNFVALNSAIEVDLTGQVNAELAGGRYVGAVGGAGNFLRGAAESRNGMGIIALPSTSRGKSRIVQTLSGPVTTPRSDVCFVVTEYGIADLRNATLHQRRERLLAIAAPNYQGFLTSGRHTY
ncbi:MAG: acetyl-CoA hydrolase/transferase C-terminal domain-containing protein [Hyphomonas sp.]